MLYFGTFQEIIIIIVADKGRAHGNLFFLFEKNIDKYKFKFAGF